MHDLLDGITSYMVAFVLVVASNTDSILSWGGLLLLLVRLIADTPRAWKNIKGLFGYDR